MKLAKLREIFLVLSFVIAKIAVKSVASNHENENKKFLKIKQDPTRYRNKNNIFATSSHINATTPREKHKINAFHTSRLTPLVTWKNYSQDKYKIDHNNEKTIPQASQHKKWQVGRVSRKQYELINILWRKTKIFVDVEPITINYNFKRSNETERINDSITAFRQPFTWLSSRPGLPPTTPSNIEFYYLDDTDERVKDFITQKFIQAPKYIRAQPFRNHGNHDFVLSNSSKLSVQFGDPNHQRPALTAKYTQPTNRIGRRKNKIFDSSLTGFDSLFSLTPSFKYPHTQRNKFVTTTTASNISKRSATLNMISTGEYINDNETYPTTTAFTIKIRTESENITSDIVNLSQKQESTIIYDKIKFFEIYDKHTPVPYYNVNGKLNDIMNNDEIFIKGNEVNNNERKVLLEYVDQSIGNEHSESYKAKHAKKHLIDTYKSHFNDQSNETSLVVTKTTVKHITLNVSKTANVTKKPMIKLLTSESKVHHLLEYQKSKHVAWSQYPFAAAYIYEPSQVHCDAAGISPHWLITSGSCLSRHYKNPGGKGRSAFVTYCGDSWWNPERVAYVKYSLVHPRFHLRDKTRRHLYNIGLIQVVTSMASTCNAWSSISLMSHQFVADEQGAIANAIGWGLDRHNTRYSSSDLPKSLLMSYKSQVFSHSCPGNIGYSKAKRLDEEGGINNVYCLALPPYSSEATDPIHGGLLLVGGKLVALYLQEERRPWGDQSALYTGTWRLVPWVRDVAREDDDVDAFTLEM